MKILGLMRKAFFVLLIFIITVSAVYTLLSGWMINMLLSAGNYSMAVNIYNHQLIRYVVEQQVDDVIYNKVDGFVDAFMDDSDIASGDYASNFTAKYNNICKQLNEIKGINNQKIVNKADEVSNVIGNEYNGWSNHREAERLFSEKKYIECMKTIKEIDEQYTQYEAAVCLYNDCRDEILYSVSSPNSVDEYMSYISELAGDIKIINDEQLVSRKEELEREFALFEKVLPALTEADNKFKDEDYVEAVRILDEKHKAYPNEQHINIALGECRVILLLDTLDKANRYAEEEKYDEALQVIDNAREVYPSKELDALYTKIESDSSFFLRVKNGAIECFANVCDYFDSEKKMVEKDGADTYIMNAGEKILLGDYSDKDVNVLSVVGSGALGFTGMDAAADVRDLSYDIQHIGEEEMWPVWLAVDTIALIPVIGVVKNLKNVKKGAEVAESVTDATKGADRIKDASKITDNVNEVIKSVDTVKDVAKEAKQLKKTGIGKVISKHKPVVRYKSINTINQKYAGKVYKTGVRFENKKVRLSTGIGKCGVFPVFKRKFQCKLPATKWFLSDDAQFRYCTRQLRKKIAKNSRLASRFSKEQLEDIKAGKARISGLTWHHNEHEGIMQLVDRAEHEATKHTGGRSIWGGGALARKGILVME